MHFPSRPNGFSAQKSCTAAPDNLWEKARSFQALGLGTAGSRIRSRRFGAADANPTQATFLIYPPSLELSMRVSNDKSRTAPPLLGKSACKNTNENYNTQYDMGWPCPKEAHLIHEVWEPPKWRDNWKRVGITPVRLVMARERDKDFLESDGSGSVAFGTSPILASEFLSTWPASETPELVVL